MRREFFIFVMIGLVCILFLVSHRGTCLNAGVTFPVLSDIVLYSDTPEFLIQNPIENKGRYILKYEFIDTVTNNMFFSTNWLEGGKQYQYRLDNLEGCVDTKVHIYAKDADTYKDVSGVNFYIKIRRERVWYEA